jgi:hypothetical protein
MTRNRQAMMAEAAADAANDFSPQGPAGEDAGPPVPENGEERKILSVPENDEYSLLTTQQILQVFQANRFGFPAPVQQAQNE